MILEPKKKKNSLSLFPLFPLFIWHEGMGPDAMSLVFWMLSFKPTFSLSSFTVIKRLFSSSLSEVIDISPSDLDYSSSSQALLMMYSAYTGVKTSGSSLRWDMHTFSGLFGSNCKECFVFSTLSRMKTHREKACRLRSCSCGLYNVALKEVIAHLRLF